MAPTPPAQMTTLLPLLRKLIFGLLALSAVSAVASLTAVLGSAPSLRNIAESGLICLGV